MSVAWSRRAGAERIQLAYRPDYRLRWHARLDDSHGMRVMVAGHRTPWGALFGLWRENRARERAARELPGGPG